jgi:pimeloyl-ACP methyl ester carboxylesterase
MGGIITAKLLTTHPERLLSATLGGHGGLREGENSEFFEALASSLEQGKGMGPLIAALTPAGRPKPSAEQIAAINAALGKTNDQKALAAVIRSFKDLAIVPDKLESNQVPTLALIGELDPLKKGVDALQGHMPNLTTVVIEGADHMNAVTNPVFIKSLTEFLDRQSSKGKSRKAA